MRRRILASAAAAALMFGLVACGDDGSNGTVTTPPPDISVEGSDGGGDEPSDGGGDSTGDGNDASDGGGDSNAAAPDIPAPDPADYPGMDQNTPEGAEQAFRYYIAMMLWGYQTGEYEDFENLHSQECEACVKNAESIRNYAEEGRYWSAPSYDEQRTSQYDSDVFDIEIGILFILGEHSEPVVGSEGITTEPALSYSIVGGLNWRDNQWVVEGMNVGTESVDEEE